MARPTTHALGAEAEALVAAHLSASGWRLLGRNVRVGRLELDIVAVDPGPPARLVAVEVRRRGRTDFGLPEETVDGRKLGRLRAAVARLTAEGVLDDGQPLPRLSAAIDVVAVESRLGRTTLRHVRDVGS
jgi:putative endonuclease